MKKIFYGLVGKVHPRCFHESETKPKNNLCQKNVAHRIGIKINDRGDGDKQRAKEKAAFYAENVIAVG